MTFFRLLLRLYPRSFRVEYATELVRAFEASHRGKGAIALALAAMADVVPNAFAAHWELLRQDLAYAVRAFSRAPGFSLTAILVVALGIGANTAALAIADYAFFRPFPFKEPDRLVRFYQADAEDVGNYGDLAPANWRDWKEQQHSFAALGVYSHRSANLVSEAEPRRIGIVAVSPDVFSVLGVPPAIGRTFASDDTLHGRAIVLGNPLWQTQFGSDPGVVGEAVRLDGVPYTVVGVMPPSFRFPNSTVEAWTPLVLAASDFEDRDNRSCSVLAGCVRG